MLTRVKSLGTALLLAIGLRVGFVQAESVERPTSDPAADADGRPAAVGAVSPSSPVEVENPPSEPRGDLVRLSRFPESELMVDVTLEGNDTAAYFEVTSDRTGASLLICGLPCRFRIWPGRYRLIANSSSGFVGGSSPFQVERDSVVRVTEPPIFRPTLGAIIGSLGIASAIVGGVLLATSTCDPDCDRAAARRDQAGAVALGVGAIAAPIGWILFGQNRNPSVTVQAGAHE